MSWYEILVRSIKVHCVFRGKAHSSSSFFSAFGSSSLNVLMNGCHYIRLAPLHVTSAGTYGIILAWLNRSAACGSGVDGVRVEVSHTAACIKTGNFNCSDTDQMGTVLKHENLMNLPWSIKNKFSKQQVLHLCRISELFYYSYALNICT